MGEKTTLNEKRTFDLVAFKAYVATYDGACNTDLYSDETIVRDMLYGIGLALDKKEFQYASGFKLFLKSLIDSLSKWKFLASALIIAFMLASCGGEVKADKAKTIDKFDLQTLPCGKIYDMYSGHLTILGNDNVMYDVEVPQYVCNALAIGTVIVCPEKAEEPIVDTPADTPADTTEDTE